MFKWILSWFRKPPVDPDDEIVQHILSKCFTTGNVVIAVRREDHVEVKEVENATIIPPNDGDVL